MSSKLKNAMFHARCGIFSGYPKCCVAFHTLLWRPLSYAFASMKTFDRLVYGPYDHVLQRISAKRGISTYWGRIVCPWCALFGKPIKSRNCARHTLCQGRNNDVV